MPCIENPNNKDLYDKVKQGFEVAGLYPYVMKLYNTIVENPLTFIFAKSNEVICVEWL